jgi:hypothetical protein
MSVLVSAVISAGMVGAAFAFFLPESAPVTPRGDGSSEEIAALQTEVDQLRNALAESNEARLSLIADLDSFRRRVEEIENAPRVAPAAALAEGAAAQPSTEEKMMAGMRAMMKVGMSRAKDRFIREVMDPTEADEARVKRQRERIVDRIAGMLELDERDTEEMGRILNEVDDDRRAKLKTLFASKADPKKDVEYAEIKKILDESFKSEDDKIRQSLSAEKVKAFEDNAAPFRQFIYGAAQMAFPEKKEGE